MKAEDHEAKDLCATSLFSLRGGRFCERGLDAVRRASFLTGMVLVAVLGLMFALSTPSFAMGGGGGGGSSPPAPKVAKVDDPVAKSKDETAETRSPVVGNEDKTETKPDERTTEFPKPDDETAGTDDPATETEDKTADTVKKDRSLDDCVPRDEVPIKPGKDNFTVNGCVVDLDKVAESPAIEEIIVSIDDPEYTIASNGIAVATATGQKKRCSMSAGPFRYGCLPDGSRVVHPPIIARVVNGEYFIRVSIGNSGFNPGEVVIEDTTFITTSGAASGGDIGVDIPWSGGHHVYFTNNADIGDVDYGIKSIHDGDRELTIINNGRILGARKSGIHVIHTNERDLRIQIENNRDDELDTEIVSLGDGIFARILAQHRGEGENVLVYVAEGARVASEEGNGVAIEQVLAVDERINQHIDVLIQGEVRGGETGVTVTEEGSSYVDILVGPEAEVHGGLSGIRTNTKGLLAIDVAGKVSGAGGVAIDMGNDGYVDIDKSHGGHYKTLILRPGYELEGTAVANGRGTLKLSYPATSGTFNASVVDLEKFSGFSGFFSEGHWIVTGEMSKDDAFHGAVVDDGILRFSDADFRLSGDGRLNNEWNSFIVGGRSILQIAGSNHLRGYFQNYGKIAFVQGAGDDSSTDASLTVTGDYHQLSLEDMVFNVDFAEQRSNKLTVFGNFIKGNDRHLPGPTRQHVSMRALDESKLTEESPVLVEVHDYAQTDSFEGEETIGAFRYVLEHEAVGEALPVPSDELGRHLDNMRRNLEKEIDDLENEASTLWRTYYGNAHSEREIVREIEEALWREYRDERDAIYETIREKKEALNNLPVNEGDFTGYHTWRFINRGLSDTAIKTSKIPDEIAKNIETPPTTNPDKQTKKLGLWGEQNGSHTAVGLNALAIRTMGGDMTVGTSMLRNSSTSNNIDVESQIAALTVGWERKGFYVGGQTRYAGFTSDVSTDRLSVVQDNEGTGVNASVDLGYRFALPFGRMDFEVAPQVQLTWSRVNFDDFVGPHGEKVSLEDGDLVTGRLGLSWDGEWQGAGGFGQIYGGMNLRSAVDGKTSVNVSGVSVANEQDDLSVDGKLGLSYEWDKGYEARGEVAAMRRDEVEEFRANLGMNINF